jgi:hypothetical protein
MCVTAENLCGTTVHSFWFQRTRNSRQTTAPPPYKQTSKTKLKGLKNSKGGEEPDNNSPMMGDKKKRASEGGNFIFLLY